MSLNEESKMFKLSCSDDCSNISVYLNGNTRTNDFIIVRDQESIQEFALYFYIACGVGVALHLLVLMLICVLFIKVRRLQKAESNQLNRQTNMMSDFCYTNPTIVPGEELSRRGFSMYCGSDNYDEYNSKNKDINFGTYHESMSKF